MMTNNVDEDKTTKIKGAEMLLTIPANKSRPKQILLTLIDIGMLLLLCNSDKVYKIIYNKTKKKKTKLFIQGGKFNTFCKATMENSN